MAVHRTRRGRVVHSKTGDPRADRAQNTDPPIVVGSPEYRSAARKVTLFLNRPPGARRIPSPDEAYAAGRQLLAAHGATVPAFGWTASAMRNWLREAGCQI